MQIKNCRLCNSEDFIVAVDLGFHPLADTFLFEEDQLGLETFYPLRLGSCQTCGHLFTLHPVTPEDRYQKADYSYDSSNSKVSIAHFKEFCNAVIADWMPDPGARIADIGSNIGTLLGHFKAAGYPDVIGIEPAANIARLAEAEGVPTLNEFFNLATAQQILTDGPVDILLSSNVVNHADDLPALLTAAKLVLGPNGRFVFEVPYLRDLVEQTAFDTIYHEHVHYYGIRPLSLCLAASGFSIRRVERSAYMCGSIRVYAEVGGAHGPDVEAMIGEEQDMLLYAPQTYAEFMDRVRAAKFAANEYLWSIRAAGGRIIGIGAATKGNTFLNYCGIDRDLVSAIADSSPLKIGKRTPGSHIPIIADEDIGNEYSHALILPWNIADFLIEKLSHLGLEFYVPQINPLAK